MRFGINWLRKKWHGVSGVFKVASRNERFKNMLISIKKNIPSLFGGGVLGYTFKDFIEPLVSPKLQWAQRKVGILPEIPKTNDNINIINREYDNFFIQTAAAENLQNLFDQGYDDVTQVIVAGNEGSGKTELALNYANSYTKNLKDKSSSYITTIVLLDATDSNTLERDYKIFAKNLSINYENKELDKLKGEVDKQLLLRRNWLIIFDNVQCFKEVKQYLPDVNSQSFLEKFTKQKGHIIFTTKLENINFIQVEMKSKVLNLNDEKNRFSKNSSIKLLENLLQSMSIVKDIDWTTKLKLVKLLNYHPQAIKNAMICIINSPTSIFNNEKEMFKHKIENYISEYNRLTNNQQKLITDITNQLTINKLRPLSIRILNFSSFINLSNIQVGLLKLYFEKEKQEDLQSAIDELEKFLIFNEVSHDVYSVSTTLRTFIKNKVTNTDDKERLMAVLRFFKEKFSPDNRAKNNQSDKALFVPHIDFLSKHLETLPVHNLDADLILHSNHVLDAYANYCLSFSVSDYVPAKKALELAKSMTSKLVGGLNIVNASSEVRKQIFENFKSKHSDLPGNYARILYALGRICIYVKDENIMSNEDAKNLFNAAINLIKLHNSGQKADEKSFEEIVYQLNGLYYSLLEDNKYSSLQEAIAGYEAAKKDETKYLNRGKLAQLSNYKDNDTGIYTHGESNNQIAKAYWLLYKLEKAKLLYKPAALDDHYQKAFAYSFNGGAISFAMHHPEVSALKSRTALYFNTAAETLILKPYQLDSPKIVNPVLGKTSTESTASTCNLDNAEMLFNRAIEDGNNNQQHYAVADAYTGLAKVYIIRALYEKADNAYEKSISIQKDVLKRTNNHKELKSTILEKNKLIEYNYTPWYKL